MLQVPFDLKLCSRCSKAHLIGPVYDKDLNSKIYKVKCRAYGQVIYTCTADPKYLRGKILEKNRGHVPECPLNNQS